MRQAGLPYTRIAALVGVSVASVHLWSKDIELTREQKAHNLRGPQGPHNPERVRRAGTILGRALSTSARALPAGWP